MDIKQAKEIIKNNYPPENYTMLREALNWLVEQAEENKINKTGGNGMAKIGDVIENKSGLFVINQITNGLVSGTVKLEDYIAINAIVNVEDEWVTIKELIETRSKMYLQSGVEIIKEIVK